MSKAGFRVGIEKDKGIYQVTLFIFVHYCLICIKDIHGCKTTQLRESFCKQANYPQKFQTLVKATLSKPTPNLMNFLKLRSILYVSLFIVISFTACSKKDKSPAPSKPDPGIVTPQAKWPANADIYFVGDFSNKTFNRVPTIWKNGVPSTLYTDGTAMGVAVSNGNVYVVGMVSKESYYKAVYWENGVLKRLPVQGGASEANAVAVSGNDIYIVGMNYKNPTIWKKRYCNSAFYITRHSYCNFC